MTSTSQELTVPEIQTEVEKINSDQELIHLSYDTDSIYDQTTDGGGSFEIWLDGKNIRKITQTLYLSNGEFSTVVYLKKHQPILISETEKHFQWKDDLSGLDYNKALKINYSELIYSYDWDKDPVKVITKGESLRKETICGISDYWSFLEIAKKMTD